MSASPQGEPLDRFAHGIVRRKVTELIESRRFRPQDRADLRQELLAGLLARLPHFRPGRAHRNVFVTVVVERLVANLLRSRRAAKRGDGRVVTFSALPSGGAALVRRDGRAGRCVRGVPAGRDDRDDREAADLAADVAAVLDTLPPEWRDLAVRLGEHTPAEVARATGVPRRTLRDRVRAIRRRFEEAGLRIYL